MASMSDLTISRLFGLAAGRCSICKIPVVEREVKIGEIAHIIAKNKGGARGSLPFTGDINGYENLILLCPNHHTEVDKNEALYPLERLQKIKKEHEVYAAEVFNHQSQGRVMDIGGLQALMKFLPFSQMLILINGLPIQFNEKLFDVVETLKHFQYDNPHCRPFSDQNLEKYYFSFWSSVCALVEYVLNESMGSNDVYISGDSVGGDFNTRYLNRKLTIDERRQAIERVTELKNQLENSYYSFLTYLKTTYPEVNLASFVGWY